MCSFLLLVSNKSKRDALQLKVKLRTIQRLSNHKVLSNITQLMKNFLNTYNNTYKFIYINKNNFSMSRYTWIHSSDSIDLVLFGHEAVNYFRLLDILERVLEPNQYYLGQISITNKWSSGFFYTQKTFNFSFNDFDVLDLRDFLKAMISTRNIDKVCVSLKMLPFVYTPTPPAPTPDICNTRDMLYAINNIPKPNFLVYLASRSELSVAKHLTNIYSSSTDMLNMFNARLKKNKTQKVKLENNYNYIGKPRHYPPANKEWFNSIYVYNNNTIKLLPTTDKVTLKLVKSYFNFYSRKLEKKIKSRRLRIRGRRLSTNRILISRAELKHTNDKVVVTIYVYNRQKQYYFNKIIRIAALDNLVPNRIKIKIIKKKA